MLYKEGAYLPECLKTLRQWAVARKDEKAPLAKGANGLYNISVNRPEQFMTFNDARVLAKELQLEVGFILTKTDGLACIDLDVKDSTTHPDTPEVWTTNEHFERYRQIVKQFNSYTETSLRGKGVHIWIWGSVEDGIKRDGVEIYSEQRFIICTGSVINNVAVTDRQELLTTLSNEIRKKQYKKIDLVEEKEELSDMEVLERATGASNSEKFNSLCKGEWSEWGFPSQSEADLALMSMFAYYSNSNAQCRRLFRCTALGKREKAVKNDKYLNYTLRLIRSRQAQEKKIEMSAIDFAANALIKSQSEYVELEKKLHSPGKSDAGAMDLLPMDAALANLAPVTVPEDTESSELTWPPGLTGQIARYIYDSAPRPVKEVSIVGALGLMAGICGKAYNIPQSGLNLYIILVARSAIGKEAMHTGISSLMNAVSAGNNRAMDFVDFNDFASGPALSKAVAKNPCFLNVSGEWGRKLRRLAEEGRENSAMSSLRTIMTHLYQKSGSQTVVGGITYSKAEDNVQASLGGVSYSVIGETTPSTFYECLTDSMMEDGFLSRFTMVEYKGDRPSLNPNFGNPPPGYLIQMLQNLTAYCASRIDSQQGPLMVGKTKGATEIMHNFEKNCDKEINATEDEAWRQLWNRASLKVMRLSALLAIGDNYTSPVINESHVNWAKSLILNDINLMSTKLISGDVGLSDTARDRKLMFILREYITGKASRGYGIPKDAQMDSVIPRKYLSARCSRISVFYKHRLGASSALNQTIQNAIDNGYIVEVPKDTAIDKYKAIGKCYRIVSLPQVEEYKLS